MGVEGDISEQDGLTLPLNVLKDEPRPICTICKKQLPKLDKNDGRGIDKDTPFWLSKEILQKDEVCSPDKLKKSPEHATLLTESKLTRETEVEILKTTYKSVQPAHRHAKKHLRYHKSSMIFSKEHE